MAENVPENVRKFTLAAPGGVPGKPLLYSAHLAHGRGGKITYWTTATVG